MATLTKAEIFAQMTMHQAEKLFNRPVEVVTPEALSPYIGPHILKTIEYATFAN